jgi:molybdopterin synthase catalytic subunit
LPEGDIPYLTRDPIDVAMLLRQVSDPGSGGTALFLGTVRRGPDDGPVESIDYSAYESMAEGELLRIVGEGLERWPQARVAVQHRLGEVQAGEASVAVVAAAPHRAEAFEACRWVIEEIKRRLPVWKRERLAEGTVRWRENGPPLAQPHPPARA